MIGVLLGSASATEALGAALSSVLAGGDVLVLSGDLGSGKTTLVTGLVEAVGGGRVVTSPTFSLCHLYDTSPRVAHVDCWRLATTEEIADLGLEEILDDGGVVVLEWGELALPLFGDDALVVELCSPSSPAEETSRIATVRPIGARFTEKMGRVEDAIRAAHLPLSSPSGDVERLLDGAPVEPLVERP